MSSTKKSSSKKDIQPFYKNWFFWILIAVAAGYFATRNNNQPSAPKVDYLTALKEKAFSRLDSGYVSEKLLNEKTSEDDKVELFERIPLEKLQSGTILYFGSPEESKDKFTITFINEKTAEVIVDHSAPVKGDSGNIQQKIEKGTYTIEMFEGDQVLTDNQDYPLMPKPALILSNLNYGADKGFSNLSKKFCIAKTKHFSGSQSVEIRIYPWMDPVNYPEKGQEFSFAASHELIGMSFTK